MKKTTVKSVHSSLIGGVNVGDAVIRAIAVNMARALLCISYRRLPSNWPLTSDRGFASKSAVSLVWCTPWALQMNRLAVASDHQHCCVSQREKTGFFDVIYYHFWTWFLNDSFQGWGNSIYRMVRLECQPAEWLNVVINKIHKKKHHIGSSSSSSVKQNLDASAKPKTDPVTIREAEEDTTSRNNKKKQHSYLLRVCVCFACRNRLLNEWLNENGHEPVIHLYFEEFR